jgi:hypothetical protein
MDKADERLKALFALDEPPSRDVAFSTVVIEKLVRRQFHEDVALLSAATLVGASVLWAVWPGLQPALVAVSQGLAPAIAVLALVASGAVILSSRAGAGVGAES